MSDPVTDYIAAAPRWGAEMAALRAIARDAGLSEAIKWRKPTFTTGDANIAILQPFARELRLMFFKGAILPDTDGLLTSQGENTQSALVLRVTSVDQVTRHDAAIRALFAAAIAAEAAGLKPPMPARHDLDLPSELVDALDADPDLATGWAALTPGRQRSWVLHFSAAKQPDTRRVRIARARPAILAGRGQTERP
jgi:uncharacterized protein YdeI (YjbR/CyaY-like superfamily)